MRKNSNKYLGSGKILLKAIKKYGSENFIRETLFEFDNPKDAYNKEKEIVNIKFVESKNTYNCHGGGFGCSYVSEKTRELLRIKNTGKLLPMLKGQLNPACRPEVKEKISNSRKGKHFPKLAVALKGRNLGKKRPEHSKFMKEWINTHKNWTKNGKGKKWWNDGNISIFAFSAPNKNFKLGRIVPWNQGINRSYPHKKNRN